MDPCAGRTPVEGVLVGGGVLAGLGARAAILAGVMGARGDRREAEFEAAKCPLYTPTACCSDLLGRGGAATGLVIGGAVVALLALGGGWAMLLIGARRRVAVRHALRPVITPVYAGFSLTWQWELRKRSVGRQSSG